MHHDLLIRGGVCIMPWGEIEADVAVADGRIAALGAGASDTAETVIDAQGLHVLPGLIDSHVHLRDPSYGLLGKGRLAAGYDADFTLVDMKARRTIEDSWIASPCGWTPFAGTEVTGWPVATIVRGRPVMRDDEVLGEPVGRLARFLP